MDSNLQDWIDDSVQYLKIEYESSVRQAWIDDSVEYLKLGYKCTVLQSWTQHGMDMR